MFISKKRWNNLVNRVERLESIVTPENAPSPLRQMNAAVREAFESGAHLAQQSEEIKSKSIIFLRIKFVDINIPH